MDRMNIEIVLYQDIIENKIILDGIEQTVLQKQVSGNGEKATNQNHDSRNENRIINLNQDTLYLSDHQVVIDLLREKGLAVAGIIHIGNQGTFMKNVSYIVEHVEEMEYDDFCKIYERIKGIPWNILKTNRLLLRESTVEDVDTFYEIYKDACITEYMENLFEDPDEERAYQQDYIKNIYEFYGYGIWTVIEEETGAVVGRAGIAPREGYEIPELGFVIGKQWQRKGYATEICQAIVNYALEELEFEQIMAIVHIKNRASQRLCEKLGFEKSGKCHDDYHEIWIFKPNYGRK